MVETQGEGCEQAEVTVGGQDFSWLEFLASPDLVQLEF